MNSDRFILATAIILLLVTTACSISPAAKPTLTPSPVSTETQTPTTEPSRMILVTSGGEAADIQALQGVLPDLTSKAGYLFETRDGIQKADLTSGVKVVLMMTPPDNLGDLLTFAPKTRFLVFSLTDIPTATNLTVLRYHPEFKAFIAGYVAAMVAFDWRAGAILTSDGANDANIQQAFANGVQYFCGFCHPMYPPYDPRPQIEALPSSSTPADWAAGFEALPAQNIETAFVAKEAASPELLAYLANKPLHLMGEVTPPEQVKPFWYATFVYDPLSVLQSVWPLVIAGTPPATIGVPIKLMDVNSDKISEGKLRLVNEINNHLMDGSIDPLGGQ